jgi:hypothetical protein
LVNAYEGSPLLNELLPAEDARVQLRQIRGGFRPVSQSEQEPLACPP